MARSTVNTRTKNPHPNISNIEAANEVRELRQAEFKKNAEIQHKINYVSDDGKGTRVLRDVKVRRLAQDYRRMNDVQKRQFKSLLEELD